MHRWRATSAPRVDSVPNEIDVGGPAFRHSDRSSGARVPLATDLSDVEAQPVLDVTGAVEKPGVYRMPAGSRVNDAVKRAGSTEADKLVDALEKTDWVGTIGRVEFYGKQDQFTHSIKYGKGLITGLMLQWQDGKQVAVWPADVAKGQLKFPSFIKVTSK